MIDRLFRPEWRVAYLSRIAAPRERKSPGTATPRRAKQPEELTLWKLRLALLSNP